MTERQSLFNSLKPDARAHNLLVGENVSIDESAQIGANVVLHDNVEIGHGCVIKHNTVIGQAPTLAPGSNAVQQSSKTTTIGDGSTICNGCVILRGATIGSATIVGDHGFVREGATIGDNCVIGRGSSVSVAARVGNRVRVQGPTAIGPRMIVEDDVFISINLAPITDRTSGRDPTKSNGFATLRRGCRIGANVSLMPGIEIGVEAVVGAGAVVFESVPARAKVVGIPARVIGSVSADELLDG
ncbi:MAG: DapH/DapD/GlmU-related protein [Solirubrobacterales bacterium]